MIYSNPDRYMTWYDSSNCSVSNYINDIFVEKLSLNLQCFIYHRSCKCWMNKLFNYKIFKVVKSKLPAYHIENSKSRGNTV